MLLFAMASLPAYAERTLSITSVYLNGFTTKEVSVRPGVHITGSVNVATNSSAFLRAHTAVWLPSWERNTQGSMRAFMSSTGWADQGTAQIDIAAPTSPGVYYLLFCFDRKNANEMYTEIILRTDDQIWANGRAIKIIVDPNAQEAPRPNSRETAGPLSLAASPVEAIAGNGTGRESWWKLPIGNLDSRNRDDAVRFRIVGVQPDIDLDLEIQDAYGRRRGYSENEGSLEETSIVRVLSNETLYARIFAFRAGEEARFKITAERVPLAAARQDVSGGHSLAVGNGYAATGHASDGDHAAWYAIPLAADGRIEVEVRGASPTRDLDLLIIDDLGNHRAISREAGSTLERAIVDPAESGVYYVRVGAYRPADESDFNVTTRVTNPAILVNPGTISSTPTTPTSTTGTPSPVSVAGLDSVQRFPVNFEVVRDRDFEGWFQVGSESSFLVEFQTNWGELGRIDTLAVFGPTGQTLWQRPAIGRRWEADRIASVGAGLYRVQVSHSGTSMRRASLDISGLADPHLYRSSSGRRPGDLGAGGLGIDDSEREILQQLYDMMNRRGTGVSTAETDILRRLEEYFTKN